MMKFTLVSATLYVGYQTLMLYRNKLLKKNTQLKIIACHGGHYDS